MKKIISFLFTFILLAATGAVSNADYSPQEYAAGRQLLEQIQKKASTRQPELDRPHVFVRSQTKYSGRLYMDYYTWFDRPLFANRRLWGRSTSDMKKVSYRKTFELYQQYGLDGFMTFAWPNQYERYLEPLYETATAMNLDPNKFNIMYCVSSSSSYANIDQVTLDQITNNPYSFRINGKSLISSYVMDRIAPEKIAEYIADWKKRSGEDVLFLPMIHFVRFNDASGKHISSGQIADLYRLHGALPATMLKRLQEYLRSYARVSDGLYIGPMINNPDFTFDKDFYAKVLFPIFKSVLAEPEFEDKLLAQQICVGYTSYHGAQNRSRNGTKTLRAGLDLATRFRPDIVIGTEWDELNEDTSFQPTVAKPMSTQRIMKYYMSQFKNIAASPNPGDNLSIPNLIISQRRQIMLGHVLDIELLNVPDTTKGQPYTVQLELLDQDGNVVFTSDHISYNTAELKGKTINLPSEDYKDCQALQPRLTINYQGNTKVLSTGLPFTTLRASTAWDQTYFCTPLRNVLQPQMANIDIKINQDAIKPGIHQASISATIDSPEELAAVEVMQNSHVIFAYDTKNEYLRNDPQRRMIDLSWGYINQPSRIVISYDVTLQNAPSARTFSQPIETKASPSRAIPIHPAKVSEAFTGQTDDWNKNHFYGYADWYTRSRLISIEEDDLEKAILTINGEEVNGKNKGKKFSWTVPLKDLGEYGVISKVFDDGLMFAVQTQYRPQHNTLPLDTGKIHFTKQLMVDNPNSVLALRLVTMDGKVWWSKPFEANTKIASETVPMYVYSDTAKTGIKLQVAKERVPDIEYDFNPRWGNILHTDTARGFYGHAGSYIYPAIDFFALGSNSMGQPFRLYKTDIFEGANKPAPEWVQLEDDNWALSFDGENGNFLALPNVVIPQRAGFALSFEVKPAEIKRTQVLFANQWHTKGTFILSVQDGTFHIRFYRRTPGDPNLPGWSYKDFDTDIPLYADKWQKVLLTYDESKLTLTANGKTQSFPFKGIGLYLQGSVFGGYGDRTKEGVVPFYHGLLRSLEIKHYVEEEMK